MARRGDGIRSIRRSRVLGGVLGAAVALAPMQAAAECAWVLWQHHPAKGDHLAVWDLLDAYEKHSQCQDTRSHVLERARGRAAQDPERKLTSDLLCLPDTIAPRGPKGGPR
jgi:hypothetical protein